MSAHDNLAARLKGGAKLAACMGPSANLGRAASSCAKQRKWRVLVSIGLLLPALAAIIGIVAWTISIEVANSDQQALHSQPQHHQHQSHHHNNNNNYHHLHLNHNQQQQHRLVQSQQQLRREEALALAAMAAARRSVLQAAKLQQQQRMNQPPGGRDEPRDAAPASSDDTLESEAPEALEAMSATSTTSTSTTTTTTTAAPADSTRTQTRRRQAPQEPTSGSPKRRRPARQQQLASSPAILAMKQTKSESSLILTNRDQAEALSATGGSELNAPAPLVAPSSPSSDEDLTSSPDNQPKGEDSTSARVSSDDEEQRQQLSPETRDNVEPKQKPNGASGRLASNGNQNDDDNSKGSVEEAQLSDESSNESADEDQGNSKSNPLTSSEQMESVEQQEQQQARPIKSASAERQSNGHHKSRWMSQGKSSSDMLRPQSTGGANRSPKQEQLSAGNQLQTAKRVHNHQVQTMLGPAGISRPMSMKQQQQSTKNMRNPVSGNNRNSLMMGSRYTLLLNESPQEQTNNGPREGGKQDSGNSETSVEEPRADSMEDSMSNKRDSANRSSDSSMDTTMSDSSSMKAAILQEAEDGGSNEASPMDTSSPSGGTKKAATDDDVSFEAIASAISSTLSNNGPRPLTTAGLSDSSLELIQQQIISATDESQADEAPDTLAQNSNDGDSMTIVSSNGNKRRRTTGQHVADVIDHIVETKRKQRQTSSDERLHAVQRGPQIVVVAPVGGQMKARSLVKSPDESQTSKSKTITSGATANTKKPIAQEVAKKATSPGLVASKSSNAGKLIGARLLGNDDQSIRLDQANSGMKYSERVEVIEDDDSSALLQSDPNTESLRMEQATNEPEAEPSGAKETDEDDKEIESETNEKQMQHSQQSDESNLASIQEPMSFHVSSHAGEPRLRAPRHQLDSGPGLERYAPQQQHQHQAVVTSTQASTTTSTSAGTTAANSQANSPAKLYATEQQIRDQVLRSRTRPSDSQQAASVASSSRSVAIVSQQPKQSPVDEQTQVKQPANPKKTLSTAVGSSQKASSSMMRPTIESNGAKKPLGAKATIAQKPASKQPAKGSTSQAKQQQPARPQQQQLQHAQPPQELMIGVASPGQSVQVPLLFQAPNVNHQQQQQLHHQHHHHHHHHHHQDQQQASQLSDDEQQHRHRQQQVQQNQIAESYQPMESQLIQQQVVSPNQEHQLKQQEQEQLHQQHQQQNQQQQQLQQQPDQAGSLPVFADQEFNVPAHMAESVINEIQRTPSTVTGMLNGQPTMFQATGPHQQQQQLQQQLYQAASQQQQHFMHHPFAPYQQQQALQFQPMPYGQPQHQMLSQQQQQMADFMRLVASQRGGQSLDQQQQLANRQSETDAKSASKQQPQQARATLGTSSLMNSVKALGPRSLVQPMAQRALRHLISSLGQQAAAQQAAADSESEPRSSSAPSALATMPAAGAVPVAPSATKMGSAEQVQASGSHLVESVVPYPLVGGGGAGGSAGHHQPSEASAGLAGRSMRSLPIGATVPSAAIQPQLLAASGAANQQVEPAGSAAAADQEVQESYGQMPAYQMADYPQPQPHYGGSDPHDKKTKGVTFHFGGGPIGGGTQLITSPMGIFKHLMIPLMPNPRVNLNGKVVFGVVLEKTTAFGAPPKKKHKFWGK